MKNLLSLLCIIILPGLYSCYAQDTSFTKAVVHADKQSYDVSGAILHHKYVQNTKRHNYNVDPASLPKTKPVDNSDLYNRPTPKDAYTDNSVVAQIFYDTFSTQRLQKLANEDLILQVGYSVDLQGNILDVSFVFPNNTSLRPVEIEKLENRLQKEVKYKINNKVYKNDRYILVGNIVTFRRLADHTANAIR